MQFQDEWSRWHHKEIQLPKKYSSNNPWIYSAECKAAGLPVDRNMLVECYKRSETRFGFHRHPDQDSPGISHDEVFGFAYLLGQGLGGKMILRKWESQYWQICDQPDFTPTPWRKLNWFGVISDFYKIWRMGVLYDKTDGKEGMQNRHATTLFPRVYPIAYSMGGWKRYLIKRHADMKPTMYETVNFFISKLHTIYTKPDSGTRILGFQLLMLEKKTFLEKVLAKLFSKRHNLKEVAAQEYKPGHPILEKL
jgi:hypothetical protein